MTSRKRSRERTTGTADNASKKQKKKQWHVPRKSQASTAFTIEPGDSGVWATCDMHREARATIELRDLFEEHAMRIYGPDVLSQPIEDKTAAKGIDSQIDEDRDPSESIRDGEYQKIDAATPAEDDIEASIALELSDLQDWPRQSHGENCVAAAPASASASQQAAKQAPALFRSVKLNTPCLLFFKTRAPVEPVEFVRRICEHAAKPENSQEPRHASSRYVKRLTPISKVAKATIGGLEEVGKQVLASVLASGHGVKYAIRPTIRNHNVLKRDEVIQKVANLMGAGHTVDLKGYDVLILVDIYQNILGMSIVGKEYEPLKRFNLAEIYSPSKDTSKEDTEEKSKEAPTLQEG